MVMEAATLSSPQRKYNVVPVQKSLSLPSYARAGGEGIDHKLIFAALEQKEKVRRKSKIFTREKTARQNIFCLPIPSTNKCRETSFSSDTSCSSLEYQKPVKKDDPKKKAKDELSASTIQPDTKTNTNLPGTKALARNVHSEFKPFLKGIQDHLSREDPVRLNVENGDTIQSKLNKNPNPPVEEVRNAHSEFKSSFKIGQGHRSPVDTLRLNVGSSDSMDRSSRSSSDSFSRKERLVAIKARVEAAREKYGESSSEEESRSSMTRYNSDGSIHRSVREGKSRSTRLERRLRRRSQDEWGIKKTIRGNTSNLSLNTEGGDGIHLNLEKPARIDDDISHLDIKTDFCPSPNYPDLTKKSYFSDFPSRENSARSVQARIRYIEDEERKRRSGSDFREVIRTPLRQSPQHLENTSPASTERKRQCEWQNSQKNSSGIDLAMRSSPILRASQAPTPPPRSPKSITFMNKTFMQRHNTNLLNHESSLDRKKVFQPNTPSMDYTKIFEQVNSINDSMSGDAKYSAKSITTSEKQINRELFSARRKTCGNFDFIDKNLLDDLCSIGSSAGNCNSPLAETKKYSSVTQIKRTDSKGYFSSSETTPFAPSEEDLKGKMWKSKWQENDQKREFMFNSLESKKKSNPPSWLKWTPPKTETCLCSLFPNNKLACICKSESDNIRQTNLDKSAVKLETFDPVDRKDMSSLTTQSPTARLCKSEVNIASNEPVRSSVLEKNIGQPYLPQTCENGKNNSKYNNTDKISATANLESAMLELESVYRSLKVSSDNLSDQNNTSIVSGNDNNNKPTNPKSNIYSFKDNLDFKRRLSICETDLKPDIKLGIDVPVNGTCVNKYSKSNAIPPRLENSVPASCNGIPDVNQLSIDELFNDLTQQLNFEQKLLKEPRENFTPLPKDNHHFDNTKRTNSPSSQISIRKEFYDNLCKSNRNQSKNFTPIVHDNKISDTGVSVGKKRYKAVRSLSQNISYLMAADTNTTVDSNTVIKNGEADNTSHTTLLDQPSPKYYEHVPFNPSKTAPKRDIATNRSNLFIKKDDANIAQNSKRDEIRHIRVSMDSNVHQPNPIAVNPLADARQYPRLSSAVGSSQVSPKSDVSKILPEETPSSDVASRENVDVLDEAGLEKLLNSLLGEVPERQQSSLLLGPTTTPPGASGKPEDVKLNRTILPLKMDVYVASKGKNKVSNTERPLENTKPEENAQKVNNFRQNNNAPINQTSFIPVYTKKTEMCHNFPKDIKEGKSPCRRSDSPDPTKASSHLYSPPLRHKFLTDQNEKIPVKTWSMHARRRSVGFEDMTSLATRYGYNLSNYQRFQTETMNCNAASGPVMSPRNTVNSEDDKRSPYRTKIESESRCISGMNQNAQVVENENDHALKTGKASQYLKDKSSKRKSSLNRMDFVDSSMSTGNVRHETQQRNSSSDEGSDTKSQQARSEFLSTTSKRKHNVCSSQSLPKAMDRTLNEVPPTISAANKSRSNPLVRALHHNQMRLRQHKRIHSAATHLQKFSHSAGELESLTDLSETASASNKICLSAQEFDTHESSGKNSKTIEKPPPKRHPRAHLMKSPPRSTSLLKNSESPSHCTSASSQSNKSKDNNSEIPLDAQAISPFENGACPAPSKDSEERVLMDEAKPVLCSLELNGALYLKHIDSRSEEDSEMALSSIKMGDLDISGEKDFDNEIYISAEENSDPPGSDVERRPSSILRKKSFEKKELHGILKPPTDDKQSKTPPSILKHRESSEEKDTYQGDLHSILKKSTSEDESCNSGPDIRPILKLSTDDESPGGSSRPRPILKKRTSFSEECFYASYPNGELKPILKKTTLLAFEEQPRPILKSRRKSEDTKSTLSEFIASRPRAYSADMGIKPHNNETRFEASELNKEDLGKCEYQDL